MAKRNVAQAVVNQLAAWGVKFIYGVTGDDLLPFLDALAQEDKIKYVGTAHEAGAGFMASYQAKLTGELAVCVASAAGTVNLLEGLADAYLDGAPVLAITGQVATSKIGTQAKQYFNQQALFGNFAGFSELCTNGQESVRLLIRAVSQALLKQTVVHLSFPKDLWSQVIEAEPGSKPPLVFNPIFHQTVQGNLERAKELMGKARRPLVVIGRKGRGVTGEIRELITAWGAGVVVAQEAKGVVPDTWPEVIGGIGEGWLPRALAASDCILLIGSASFEQTFFPQVPIIQIASQPWEISEVYMWDSLAGGLANIIASLTQSLGEYRPGQAWQEQLAAEKAQLAEQLAKDRNNSSQPIHPARLMTALSQVVARDAIITLDEGAFNHWFDRSFQGLEQHILMSSKWRSMGAGLPAAIAAQLNCPEKQVVALVGDGGLLMSLGELTTAVKLGLPITIVVVTNRVYGLEVDKTIAGGFKGLGLKVQAPDFCAYAQACGAKGFRVEAAQQLEGTLSQALAIMVPALVEVITEDARLPEQGRGD